MDALAALMGELHFAAAGYRLLDLGAPWTVSFDQAGLRGIHIVLAGDCEIVFGDGATRPLGIGDLIIAPRADEHVLRSRGATAAPLRPSEMATTGGRITNEGSGPRASVLCGAFVFRAADHPALLGLPRFLHLPGEDADTAGWLAGYIETLKTEALNPGPGTEVVLGNLTAALLTRALRQTLGQEGEAGWLGGLADPSIARVLAAMHDDIARAWTLAELAAIAGRSRATFARRFAELVGEPPIQYLFRFRMSRARALLKGGRTSLAAIADAVGYGSEAAFSAAFQRHAGTTPGAFRDRRGR